MATGAMTSGSMEESPVTENRKAMQEIDRELDTLARRIERLESRTSHIRVAFPVDGSKDDGIEQVASPFTQELRGFVGRLESANRALDYIIESLDI